MKMNLNLGLKLKNGKLLPLLLGALMVVVLLVVFGRRSGVVGVGNNLFEGMDQEKPHACKAWDGEEGKGCASHSMVLKSELGEVECPEAGCTEKECCDPQEGFRGRRQGFRGRRQGFENGAPGAGPVPFSAPNSQTYGIYGVKSEIVPVEEKEEKEAFRGRRQGFRGRRR